MTLLFEKVSNDFETFTFETETVSKSNINFTETISKSITILL